jgi:hypothetical protein
MLLRELGAAMRAGEQVPDRFVELGKHAFAWQGIDAELAELSYDSAADSGTNPFATARGNDAVLRTLTFTAGPLSLEIEMTGGVVRGQVLPAGSGLVVLSGADGGRRTSVVDVDGWFAVTLADAQPFSLMVRTAAGAIATGSITP